MSIKYYRIAKGEELPEEFCAVRNVNGEPSEYTWYERMSNFERELWVLFTQSESDWFAGSEYRKLQAENAKLRMLIDLKQTCWKYVGWCSECRYNGLDDEHDDCNCTVREKVNSLARELGVEVE